MKSFLALGIVLMAIACKDKPKYSSAPAGAGQPPLHTDTNAAIDGTSGGVGPDGKPLPVGAEGANLVCAKENGRKYTGLGGEKLEAGRVVEAAPQTNRYRLKSYELLEDSYRLAFNEVPRLMNGYRQTFGQAEPRWFLTPVPSVFTNHALFILGRQAAQNFIRKDRSWGNRTSPEKIKEGCTLFAGKVWKQAPAEDAIKACETYMNSPELAKLTPADRWSYGMAMLLSSVDFIAY